tara:strand:- start:3011 stop:5314 length:2304 start_codon:yes stop_codon:yes gene_type:complete
MIRKLTTTTSVVALAAALLPLSFAQGAEEEALVLEEITVTAQKRAESLQDIPIAITAIGGDQLREDDISNLQDIGNRTPGLAFAAFSVGQPEIAIRGIGTKEDGASASDSTVVSVDDVYIAARTAQVFDIFDLERVEVLRGPQGTLYGKNTIGGAINFVTSKPTEETELRIRQTVGNYGRFDTGAMLSGQIAENLFGKFSFSRRSHDGYLTNVLQGSEHFGEQWGESNTFAYRATLRWLPTEKLEVMLTADGADDNMGASNREPFGSAGPLHDCGCASDPIAVNEALGGAGDPHTTLSDTEGFTERDVEGYNMKVTWDGDSVTFMSISAYRESTFDWLEDSEGLPPSSAFVPLNVSPANFLAPASSGFAFDVNDAAIETTEQITQEFRLLSNSGEKFNWVAGLFYSHEEVDRTESFFFPSIGLEINGEQFPSAMASIQTNESNSYAAYADASYDVSEQLTVRGGIRYSYEEKEMTAAADVTSGIGLLLQDFDKVAASEDWDNVSWRLVADWKFDDNSLAYASVATGFKAGGFTGSASTAERATTPFDNETATNYEIGIKTQLWDNRLRLNLAGFYTDYKDLQVTRFFQPQGGTFGEFITENAGSAEIKGIELEFTALLTEGLEMGGSYSYLDAEYTEFDGTPDVSGGGDFSGNRLRQAPEHMLSLYGKYTHQLEDGSELSAKLSYRYQSLSFYDPNNNPITIIPAYDIFDARLGWTSADNHWNVAAWVKNLTDEDYVTHIFSQRGSRIAFATYGDPRTYGLTITYNY